MAAQRFRLEWISALRTVLDGVVCHNETSLAWISEPDPAGPIGWS